MIRSTELWWIIENQKTFIKKILLLFLRFSTDQIIIYRMIIVTRNLHQKFWLSILNSSCESHIFLLAAKQFISPGRECASACKFCWSSKIYKHDLSFVKYWLWILFHHKLLPTEKLILVFLITWGVKYINFSPIVLSLNIPAFPLYWM